MVRPKQEIKKELRVTIRLTQNEYDALKCDATKAGIKLSAYVRMRVTGQQVYARISKEELEILQSLVECKNGFTKISNLIREKDWTGTVEMNDYLAHEIGKIINLFKAGRRGK